MRFEVRSATSRDLSEVHLLTRRAYSGWEKVLGYPPQPVDDDHAPRITRGEVLVTCNEDKVVGVIAVEPGDDHDLIFNVAVDPDFQGIGIGRRLIAEAEDRARRRGTPTMRLYTNALMSTNIELYCNLGYSEVGRRQSPVRAESTIVDMEKSL